MAIILLSKNKYAVVDDSDFAELNQYKWYAMKNKKDYYAARHERGKTYNRKTILMHRQIVNASEFQDVDHKNRNTLDNRRENLRECSRSQNMANMKSVANTTSTYKGVQFQPERNKWRARIGTKHLGRFNTGIEAALAYDRAAIIKYGEFARLNILKRSA